MNDQVARHLAELDAMPGPSLREHWLTLVGAPLPRISPKLMRLALAWEIQAKAFGGHSRETIRKLDQLAAGRTRTTSVAPGARLVREWNGVAHVISIDESGIIHWDGRTWNSLSEVARAITGTRWSGPAFFGLKKRVIA